MSKIHYTKELMQEAVDNSVSIAGVCRYIGLKPVGGNYKTVSNKIKQYEIDISHFTWQFWNKGEFYTDRVCQFPLEDLLKENVKYNSDTLKRRLYKSGLKERKCEICGLNDEEIVYELHHINGDHYDNRLENLQILCPNCHSKTENFRGRGDKRSEPESLSAQRKIDKSCVCLNCGKEFVSDRLDRVRKFCSRDCYNEYLSKGNYLNKTNSGGSGNLISEEELKEMCSTCKSILEISEKLRRDRGTVRTYMKKYNLYDSFKAKH